MDAQSAAAPEGYTARSQLNPGVLEALPSMIDVPVQATIKVEDIRISEGVSAFRTGEVLIRYRGRLVLSGYGETKTEITGTLQLSKSHADEVLRGRIPLDKVVSMMIRQKNLGARPEMTIPVMPAASRMAAPNTEYVRMPHGLTRIEVKHLEE
jgi:hypothetical protein